MSLRPQILKSLLHQPASIADLRDHTQVSLPTLRKAIQELTEESWIQVVGQAETNGGRPAMLYGLDDSHFLLLGVHLQLPGLRLVAATLTGHVVHVEETYTGVVPRPDQAVTAITDYHATIQTKFPNRQVIGVGVATPGFTHPITGDIISIGRVHGWQNVPIRQRLEQALSLPTFVANDIDCMAFAEFQHTNTALEQNLVYLGFDESVKASMFLNGQLYKGSFGNAGLITPELLQRHPSITTTDAQNLLTIDGINRLFASRVADLSSSEKAPYADILATPNARERLHYILGSAEEDGLRICQDIRWSLNMILATATANLIYVIQPDKLVLGGWLGTISQAHYTTLERMIREHLSPLFANASVIEQAALSSPNVAALGAIFHFLQEYLKAPEVTIYDGSF
jgi:predicted NBD/HSP70 family sugar kinase